MKIKSTADISIETLNDMIADSREFDIIVQDGANYPAGKKYDVFEMLDIKREIKKFLKGCPKRDPSNPNSEKEIFTYIYTKLAYLVEYDSLAKDIKTDASKSFLMYSMDYLQESAGLNGAMCKRYALCSGFAEALRNLLAEKGIEAKYMSGRKKVVNNSLDEKGHAWNQVRLDGVWYNCDITHDRDFIISERPAPCFLKSNYEFADYSKYPVDISPKIEGATKSVPLEEQTRLINFYREIVLAELYEASLQGKKKPGFIRTLLEKLGLKKQSESEERHFE